MYTLTVKGHFDAAHFLPGHHHCGNIHGHTWKVEVVLQGEHLNKDGMLVDFAKVKSALKKCLGRFDHGYSGIINEIITVPTAENLAKYIFDDFLINSHENRIRERCMTVAVTVWESENAGVTYSTS